MNKLFDPLVQPSPEAPSPSIAIHSFMRCQTDCTLGTWQLILDGSLFDFHLDVAPDFIPESLTRLLTNLRLMGFEPIPEDECEPELLDNGRTRIYLVPIEPVDDTALIPAPRGD